MATSTAAGSARPMRADARRNYERLLTEARAVFAEHGTDASLEEIARRSGVGIGTLYRHFPNRHAMMNAVFQEALTSLLGRTRTGLCRTAVWGAGGVAARPHHSCG